MSGWSPVSRYTCALFDIREVYTLSEEVIHVFFKCVHVRDTQHSAHAPTVCRDIRTQKFRCPASLVITPLACVSQEATLLDLDLFTTQREPLKSGGGRWGARGPAVTLPRATPSKRSGSRDSLLAARSPGSDSFASHR